MHKKKFFDGTLSTFLTSGVLYSYDDFDENEPIQSEESIDQHEDETQ
jgi:hypothetical protein